MNDSDHIEALLASGPTIEELQQLAQSRSPIARLQVITLAGALTQVAFEGGVPDLFVLDVVRVTLDALKAPDPTAN